MSEVYSLALVVYAGAELVVGAVYAGGVYEGLSQLKPME